MGTQQKGWQTNFLKKCWTKHDVNKLLKTLRDTGTVDRRPEIWILISLGSVATRLRWGG